MKTSTRILNILFVAALILALVPVGSGFAEGILVNNGYDPNATMKTGVQLFNFGNSGYPKNAKSGANVGNLYGGSITPGNVKWASSNGLDLTYSAGLLTLTVTNSNGTYPVSNPVGDLGDLNYIKLTIDNGTKKTDVNLINLTIVPSAVGQDFLRSGGAGVKNWSISGIDLTGGFIMTGTLELAGPQPGSATNIVEIGVGYTQVPMLSDPEITPNPVFLNGFANLSAFVQTYNSLVVPDMDGVITSAQYNLDGGEWQEMIATDDGLFDDPTENVSASFSATKVGDHTACVQAKDSFTNLLDDACADFSVHYVFEGFSSPIVNETVNAVKAGRTIPVIWRLTDNDGIPIDNPDSFEGLASSYGTTCEGISDTTTLLVDAYPGASDLQYLGDGYWQYNWKTSKDYAGSCYMLFVEFDSEQVEGGVEFQFK